MVGVRTRDAALGARVVIDATGYRSVLLKQAGLDPGMRRFGVGAEYDMYAPHCDEREAVLLVGSEFAPAGLRVGVSVGAAPGAGGRGHHSSGFGREAGCVSGCSGGGGGALMEWICAGLSRWSITRG